MIGETVEITVHATDHAGGEVQAVALFLNNELLVTLPEADSGSDLRVFTYPYQANGSGEFVLQAAAQNSAGQWGEFAETTFTVGGFMVRSPLDGTTAPAEIPPTDASPVTETPTITPPIDASPVTSTPTPVPPTPVPPTPVPPTDIPPTNTNTPVPPTLTPTPVPDTQRPVILELEWSPLSPLEDEPVSFFVLAEDNVGVTLIEIYFVRQGDSEVPLHTCSFAEECDFTASSGFSGGTYSYYARAYDAAGNQVSTFIQTVLVQTVIE
ncbi:MAG: hypothetical protein R6X32_00280 [Chloroflexota bacterium]